MGIMSRDIGVDLGTSNVRIFVKGRGIVLNEPSVVAINKITGEVLAVGHSAKEMLGRTPDSIVAVRPLKDGVIADFDSTRMMLETFISKVIPKSLFLKPRLVISIPYGITDVEERAVEGVAYKAGAKEVYLIEEVMAASFGSRIKVEQAEGSMIVDIGGGTSEMAVLSLGGIVVSSSLRLAGEKFDKDIVEYVRNKFNCIIAETDAEEVKKQIGSAYATMTEEKFTVKGRNLNTGLPEDITLTTKDIQMAIMESIEKIVKTIKLTLEQTPPELSADIMDHGIIITGGSALIKNLDRYISGELGLPVHIAENPLDCVIKGIGATLDSIQVLKKAIKTKKK
ncbi:MAG: rod shape-determining protein [Clostridia bacterium]|nr:rod shape-determining protein [Clostridia bacterium]MDD4386859.1 rod shape-determining protein [Clostridia bacterium]